MKARQIKRRHDARTGHNLRRPPIFVITIDVNNWHGRRYEVEP